MTPTTPSQTRQQSTSRSPIAHKSSDKKSSTTYSFGLDQLSKPLHDEATMADDVLDPLLTTPRKPFDLEPFSHFPKFPLPRLPELPATDTLLYLDPLLGSSPIRVSSQLLLATKSSVLTTKFKPTYQYRILRRKKLLQNGLPMGIRFVVDLSPPVDGDEAVNIQETMYVPTEIRQWENQDIKVVRWEEPDCGEIEVAPGGEFDDTMNPNLAAEERLKNFREKQWGATIAKTAEFGSPVGPPSLSGHDSMKATEYDEMNLEKLKMKRDDLANRLVEFENNYSGWNAQRISPEERIKLRAQLTDEIHEVKKQINDWQIKFHGHGDELGCKECAAIQAKSLSPMKPEVPRIPGRKLPLEYSLSRHLSALERVLALITHNLDPKLHSATMWYTFFLTARNLQLLHIPAIVDTVLEWLFRPGNVGFIEEHTELCFMLADELRAPMLLRECFALSVARGRPFNEHNPYWSALVVARGSFYERHVAVFEQIRKLSYLEDYTILPEMAALTQIIEGNYDTKVQQAAEECQNFIKEVVKINIDGIVDDVWGALVPNKHKISSPQSIDELKVTRLLWQRLANIKIFFTQDVAVKVYGKIFNSGRYWTAFDFDCEEWFQKLRASCKISIDCVCNFSSKTNSEAIDLNENNFNKALHTEYHSYKQTALDPEAYFAGFSTYVIGQCPSLFHVRETISKLSPIDGYHPAWPPTLPDKTLSITVRKNNEATVVFTHPYLVQNLYPALIFANIGKHIQSLARPILEAAKQFDEWSDQTLLGSLTDDEWKYLPSWASGGGIEPAEALENMMIRVGSAPPVCSTSENSAWSIEGEGRTEVSEKSWSRVDSMSERSYEFGVISGSEDGFGGSAHSEIGDEERRVWEKIQGGEKEERVVNWGHWRLGMGRERTLGSEMFGSGSEREGTVEVEGESEEEGDEVITKVGGDEEEEMKVLSNDGIEIDWDEEEEWDDDNFE